MLEKLVHFAVARRGVMLILAAIVLAAAIASARRLSIDAVADVTNVQVTVLTTAPGLSPAALPKIDIVTVSHNHMDHMDAPTLRGLGPATICDA